LLLAFFTSVTRAQKSPVFAHERDMYVPAWTAFPTWNGKLLLQLLDNKSSSPLIEAIERDGRREDIAFDVPGSSGVFIYAFGAGADGSIVVSGGALSSDSRGIHFITWVAADRGRRALIRTEPFTARALAVAPDGTVWAVGRTFDFDKLTDIERNVLVRYDTSGRVLSQAVVKNAKSWANKPGDAAEGSFLLASNDRVGWFTNGCQYIEFGLDGSEVGRYDGPDGMVWLQNGGYALSPDDELVVGRRVGANSDLLVLDRAARRWVIVGLADQGAEPWTRVLGFDGNALVTAGPPGTLRRWVRTGASQ
jgi:hypothetical protein